ncbi:hypothetical protein MFLAVUS_009487 [Mucor flavus]|uniref:Uncharacterized protein n=1 Tax=Mucor flavus TaxID=439312 RepID=A0ABP9ZA08_9FUNG
MLKFYLIQAAIATISIVNAETAYTTFKVIHAPNYDIATGTVTNTHKMGVRMQGHSQIYLLDNSKSIDGLLYAATLPVSNVPYQYVVVDKHNQLIETEPFYRPSLIDSGTLNEFYGRQDAVKQISAQQLPRITYSYKDQNKDALYSEGLDRSGVHPMAEVPTFHIKTLANDFKTLREKVLEDIGINANITRITSKSIDVFNNVKIELSGQTSRLFKKLSYSVNIGKDGDNLLNGYRKFKLRSCATDPSYLREKMVYDILDAAQVPTAKSSYIRLFINEEPQGLYLIADNYKNPFLKNLLGSTNKKYKNGGLFQGSMQENPLAVGKLQLGANLAYLGSNPEDYIETGLNMSVYKVQEEGHKDGKHPLKSLIKFIEFIHKTKKYNLEKKKDLKKVMHSWDKKFDVSLFLKHMVFEILMGHNDGYMGAAHNYMIYQDPDQEGRFIWLASDLDQTLGNTLISPRSRPARTRLETLDRYGLLDNMTSRPLVNQILQVKEYNERFIQIFSDVYYSLFKTNAISNHLFFLKELIKDDVAWDKQIEKIRIDNFKDNQTVYQTQLNQKVLQLPLGHDFFNRINMIDFETAVDGTIENHPSITSLSDWFRETSDYLQTFISGTNV